MCSRAIPLRLRALPDEYSPVVERETKIDRHRPSRSRNHNPPSPRRFHTKVSCRSVADRHPRIEQLTASPVAKCLPEAAKFTRGRRSSRISSRACCQSAKDDTTVVIIFTISIEKRRDQESGRDFADPEWPAACCRCQAFTRRRTDYSADAAAPQRTVVMRSAAAPAITVPGGKIASAPARLSALVVLPRHHAADHDHDVAAALPARAQP